MVKILAIESFPRAIGTVPFSVVLRDFGPDKPHRFVTHCRNDDTRNCGNGSYYWGHYFNDENEAREDFTLRVARYRKG